MMDRRLLTEADLVSMFLPTHLIHEESVAGVIACCQPGGDLGSIGPMMTRASRTTLWALLQALLEGEKRRAFTTDWTCSAVVQDLIDLIEDELWRSRQRET